MKICISTCAGIGRCLFLNRALSKFRSFPMISYLTVVKREYTVFSKCFWKIRIESGKVFSTNSRKDSNNQEDSIKKDLKENILTVPNALCVLRIALSPVLGYLVVDQQYTTALGLFIFAGFTDLLDGYIARRFPSQMSNFGSSIDPLADKILVSVLVVTLTYNGLLPIPLTAVIIGRDVLLLLGALYLRYATLEPPKTLSRYFDVTKPSMRMKPTRISKYNTGVQITTIAASLAAPIFDAVDHPVVHFLWYLTACTTVLSGLSYASIKNNYEKL